jgi:hypothetical protein
MEVLIDLMKLCTCFGVGTAKLRSARHDLDLPNKLSSFLPSRRGSS